MRTSPSLPRKRFSFVDFSNATCLASVNRMNLLRCVSLGLLTAAFSARAEPLAPQTTFEFPFLGYDLQFDPPRGCVFVPDFYGQRLLRVSLTNGVTLQEFAFTNAPVYGTISPNRQRLYMGLWQTNLQAGTGTVVEIDLNTMRKTSEFHVNTRPGFMVATDNRVVIVSDMDDTDGDSSVITSYSAASGAVLSQQPGAGHFSAWAGDWLALHPSQAAIYYLDTFYYILPPTGNTVGRLGLNPFTGNLTQDGRWYQNLDVLNYGAVWALPSGTQVLLGSGEILTSSANAATDLKFVRYLERYPAQRIAVDNANHTLLTFEADPFYGPPHRVHQFDLQTLDYGASIEVASNVNYYWMAAAGDVLWLGGRQDSRTYIDTYPNPGRGGATNKPPVPNFAPVSPVITTTNTIQFDASTSRDDTTPLADLRFRWDLDNDGQFDTELLATPLAEHHFNLAGTNWVTLEVRDRFGLSARVKKAVVVAQAVDVGFPADSTSPFVLPFPANAIAFDLPRMRLYALDSTSNELLTVNLTTGLAERRFAFDFQPLCLSLAPDGRRLFVGMTSANGQQGYLAEFQSEPFVKLRELSIPIAPVRLAAADSGLVVIGGNAGGQGCLRTINTATDLPGACLPLAYGPLGLAFNPAQDRIYVAEGYHWAAWVYWTATWQATLLNDGSLTNRQDIDPTSGTGDILPALHTNWVLRGSGDVSALDGTILTNLGTSVLAAASDAGRNVLVTTDGALLRTFDLTTYSALGSYDLHRLTQFLATSGGLVYLASIDGPQTFVESRPFPATTPEENRPPLLEITSPANGVVVRDGQVLTVTVEASDSDGNVTNVSLFVDGQPLSMASASSASWPATPPGDHTLVAVAQDNWGAISTSAPVRLHVNFPPSVEIVSPPPDAYFVVPATVVLAVDASDCDGRIVSVDLYRNYTLAVTLTNPPFTYTFIESNQTYNIYWAVATDDTGTQTGTPERYSYFIGLPGDDIADAFALGTVSQFFTNVSNVAATRQKNEPLHAGKMGSNSLWWTWTAPANGSLILSTRGSSFDTVLAAYAGPSWPWDLFGGLQLVASNDDAPGIAPSSRLKFDVQQNTLLFIAVDGVNGACGNIQFQLDFQPQFSGTTNDFFAFRAFLTGGTNNLLADTDSATREAGEPLHAGNAGGRSLWWEWNPPGSGYVTVSTEGSEFDTLLAVYIQANRWVAASVQNLAQVAANDDDPRGGRTSWLRFPCDWWQTYFIALDGYDGAGGQARLSVVWTPSSPQRPPNDDFANAAVLSGLQVVVTGSNQEATSEVGEPRHADVGGGLSVWWKWTAPDSGQVTLSTKGSDFDTVLAVYTGTNVAALSQLGANDDDPQGGSTSALQLAVVKDTTYWIAVDGYGGSSGNVVLSMQTRGIDLSPHLGIPRLMPGELLELDLSNGGFEWVVVESSLDLRTWWPLSTNRLLGATAVLTVPRAADQPCQFYRVRIVQ